MSIIRDRLSPDGSARNVATTSASGIRPVRSSVTRRRNSESDERGAGCHAVRVHLPENLVVDVVDAPDPSDGVKRRCRSQCRATTQSATVTRDASRRSPLPSGSACDGANGQSAAAATAVRIVSTTHRPEREGGPQDAPTGPFSLRRKILSRSVRRRLRGTTRGEAVSLNSRSIGA